MLGQGQVLLHLRQLGRQNHRNRVFLPIHGALLQRREHLGPGHGRGQNAEGLVALQVHLVFHRADLQAAGITGLNDRPFVVGHVAKTVLGPRQSDQALGGHFLEQVLSERAIHHLAGVLVVTEQEGNIDDLDLGHKVTQGASGCIHQVLCAQLHRFNHFALTAQGSVGKLLAFVATLCAFFNLVTKRHRAHTVVGIDGRGVADLHDGLRAGRAGIVSDSKMANNSARVIKAAAAIVLYFMGCLLGWVDG